MEKEHIVRAYDDDLKEIQGKVLDLGAACINQLNNTIEALTNRDTHLAKLTVKADSKVNILQHEVDELSVKLLATRQPVAGDLRNVISGLRISTDLERIADYAANIAQVVLDIKDSEVTQSMMLLTQMCEIALDMLKKSVEAYKKMDVELAIEVWHEDSRLDATYSTLLDQLRNCMTDNISTIDSCTQLIYGARSCERMGDHITNVVESIYYIQTGEMYRGQKGEDDRH